jgi:ATP-dependent DNA helicase RecG
MMKRIPVISSALASVGYDPQQQILEIEFNNGGLYQYFEVSPQIYQELMSADSHGTYFNHQIREVFRYSILRPPRF